MRRTGENMQAGSLCGHGQLGFNPVGSALRYFPGEFEDHILRQHLSHRRLQRAEILPGAVTAVEVRPHPNPPPEGEGTV